jgi:prepilin-type N-terminal cleavage/methylation domain-containing protein
MTSASTSRRYGFTLIELLVVLAVIALLVGLLLPAVQYVREAAHRTACANNLKQIGLALRQYAVDKGALPPSNYYVPVAPTQFMVGGGTWAVSILPYLEQHNLYDQWDPTVPYFLQADGVRQANLSIFFCLSRRDAETAGLSVFGDEPILDPSVKAVTFDPFAPGAIQSLILGPQVAGALGDYAANLGTSGASDVHDL